MGLAAFLVACPANEGAKRLVVARFYEGRRGFVHGVYPQINPNHPNRHFNRDNCDKPWNLAGAQLTNPGCKPKVTGSCRNSLHQFAHLVVSVGFSSIICPII